jgi:DNA-binding Lrp family transcriptional regulator
MALDQEDKRLLDLLQEELPLEPRPFAVLGQRLGLKEEEVLARLKRLQEEGVLRHLGASLDSRRLGFVTTLAAVSVPPEEEEKAARTIAAHPEVTHCYLRKHRLNIWFTLVARDYQEIEELLQRISQEVGASVRHFPATRLFKLRATFRLGGDAKGSRS